MRNRLAGAFWHGSLAVLMGAWSGIGGILGLAVFVATQSWHLAGYSVVPFAFVALLIAHHNQKKRADSAFSPAVVHAKRVVEEEWPITDDRRDTKGQFIRTCRAFSLVLKNDPPSRSRESHAAGVRAFVSVTIDGTRSEVMSDLEGRWGRDVEPPTMSPGQSVDVLKEIDFPVGVSRHLHLCISTDTPGLFAFFNDASYSHRPHYVNPRFVLAGKRIMFRINLIGGGVDASYVVEFDTESTTGLVVDSQPRRVV